MAALFFKYSDSGIFKNSVGAGGKIVNSDLLSGIAGEESAVTILTGVSITHNETVQFFQSFGDLVHYFYFGRGLGQIHLDLMCFLDCKSKDSAPGVKKLWDKIGQKRGKKIDLTFDSITVSGILMSFNISAVAEPETHFIVSIDLGMIESNLPNANITGSC